jgi:hypothetical protein
MAKRSKSVIPIWTNDASREVWQMIFNSLIDRKMTEEEKRSQWNNYVKISRSFMQQLPESGNNPHR